MKPSSALVLANLTIIAVLGGGCSESPAPKKPRAVQVNQDPWTLVCTDATLKAPAIIGNGNEVVRVGRDGFEISTASSVTVDGVRLDPVLGSDYEQTLDMKTGVIGTSWNQRIGANTVKLSSRQHGRQNDLIVSTDRPCDVVQKTSGTTISFNATPEKPFRSVFPAGGGEGFPPPDWTSDIVIDGPIEDQQAVRSFIHYLRAVCPRGMCGPFGTSNDQYRYKVFWDTDVWILPSVLFLDKSWAGELAQFRIKNAKIVDGKCRFPWESDENGDEASTAPTRSAEHQSGDVMLGLEMAAANGQADRADVDRIGKAVARFFETRMERNALGQWEMKRVTSVDEWREGDNCLYTNAVAYLTVRRYLGKSLSVYYPRNVRGELLAYEGDRGKAYKQTAAPLVLWPLEHSTIVSDPIAFLKRFEGKETPNGPAMSMSVYALLYARYQKPDEAYKIWRESWTKYTDGNPLLLFSEKKNKPDLTYFATGAAGCLNAVIYGFLGAKIQDSPASPEDSIKMANGKWLVFAPHLPQAWRSLTFKGMWVGGRQYDVIARKGRVKITPAGP